MLIGQDFPKMEFSFAGMNLVEPNSFLSNSLIFLVSIYCFRKTSIYSDGSLFFKYWARFYLISGITFFTGGLAHMFFNQWGVPGKYFSWILGMISVTFIELAMVSVYPSIIRQHFFNKLIFVKLILVIIAEILIIRFVDLQSDPAKGMIVPTLNAVIGLGFVLGGMGYYYQKKLDASFKYLWISALVLIPITAIQVMKINILPWFDRNDFSHLLLIIGCFLYLITIKRFSTMNHQRVS